MAQTAGRVQLRNPITHNATNFVKQELTMGVILAGKADTQVTTLP